MTWKDGIPYDCYNRKIEVGDELILLHTNSTNRQIVSLIADNKIYFAVTTFFWDKVNHKYDYNRQETNHKVLKILKWVNSTFIIKKHYESDGNKSN